MRKRARDFLQRTFAGTEVTTKGFESRRVSGKYPSNFTRLGLIDSFDPVICDVFGS